MDFILHRQVFTPEDTIGQLFLVATGSIPICYTLEPVDRGLTQDMTLAQIQAIKIQNTTAIPYGRYQILMQWSNHFNKMMPHLQNVPDYTDLMIHPLNTPAQTEGCIGVGEKAFIDHIEESQLAFGAVMDYLEPALTRKEDCFITIVKDTVEAVGLQSA